MVLAINHLLLNEKQDSYELEFVSIYTESVSKGDKYRQEFSDYKEEAIRINEAKGNITKKVIDMKTVKKKDTNIKDIIKETLYEYSFNHGSITCNFSLSDIGIYSDEDIESFYR